MYRQSKQAVQQVLDSGKQHHRNIAAEICNNKIYFKSKRSSNRSSTAVGSAIELQRPKFAITKYTKNKQAVQHVCIKLVKLHQIIEPKFAIRKCTYKVSRVSNSSSTAVSGTIKLKRPKFAILIYSIHKMKTCFPEGPQQHGDIIIWSGKGG